MADQPYLHQPWCQLSREPLPDHPMIGAGRCRCPDRDLELAYVNGRARGYSEGIGYLLPGEHRPIIVCLVGSTRFYDAFRQANYDESKAGRIVLSIGFYPRDDRPHWQNNGVTPEEKEQLDQLHLRKVELADEILVISEGGYFGESTSRELAHAKRLGKRIRWRESIAQELWLARTTA